MKKLLLTLFILASIQNQAQCWKQISSGGAHTLGLKDDGTLWAWGLNSTGQLGDGTTINKNTPVQIGTDNDWSLIAGDLK